MKPLPLPVLVPKCQTRVNKGDIAAGGNLSHMKPLRGHTPINSREELEGNS
ncbi:MAG: hypothetical protein N2112_02145 [Gemmataceae bacterium]|nr:hypothetical protein [Gemmataceae bacterium]